MESSNKTQLPPPPGVIGALKSGLDVISSHLSVLLLPLALDALLWFGPHVSIKNIFAPLIEQAVRVNADSGLPMDSILAVQKSSSEFLGQFNLLSLLRTFPVGVFSLMSGKMPVQTPYGAQTVIEVGSAGNFILLVFGLILIGWILGGLYFNSVSRVTGYRESEFGAGRAVTQTVLFSMGLTILLAIAGLPILLTLVVLQIINPVLMEVGIILLAMVLTWTVVPLFFSPLGIYLRGESALYSTYSSLRMTRFTLPTSSMFVLAVFLISYGLNFLWAVPPDDSWMMLVGIAGHAFITTALLAASFIYYREMNAWLQIVLERLKPGAAAPQT